MDFETLWHNLEIPKEKTSVTKEEGKWLFDAVTTSSGKKTLEIGLGYGASSVCLAAPAEDHTTIEPSEIRYEGLGRKNLETAKLLTKTKIINQSSDIALPALSESFDVIFIDGSHRFADIFVDLHYSLKLLKEGGVLALHDCWREANQKILKYIQANVPSLEAIPTPTDALKAWRKGTGSLQWFEFKDF